jgi:eukaryotic-like serine/threonine-protein kinase
LVLRRIGQSRGSPEHRIKEIAAANRVEFPRSHGAGPWHRLGAYDVVALLGIGGMGEVYRARDTRLKRDVALKILPASLAGDRDRLARFQREAEVLASLDHPHIGAIYGIEESDGTRALVLQLVEGDTLAGRVARGPLPLEDALPIARQIADALEAAHEQGIVHRDLKPANVKITPDGVVKVLDFGLAKLADPVGAGLPPSPKALADRRSLGVGGQTGPNVSQSPTITSPALMTGVGMLLGTAAYMSPEQAKGRPADKRSDVWAFGCVLYEMLTGKRAFEGEDVSDTLAAVLRGEPDQDRIPADVPASIRSLIDGCLKKDRKQRIGDIYTAIFLLRQRSVFAPAPTMQSGARPLWKRAIPVLAAGIVGSLLTGAALWTLTRRPSPPLTVTRFSSPLGERELFASTGHRVVAISPDGKKLVFAAGDSQETGEIEERRPTVQRLYDRCPTTQRGRFRAQSKDQWASRLSRRMDNHWFSSRTPVGALRQLVCSSELMSLEERRPRSVSSSFHWG